VRAEKSFRRDTPHRARRRKQVDCPSNDSTSSHPCGTPPATGPKTTRLQVTATENPIAFQQPLTLSTMRILILDDCPDFRRVTGSSLRRMGHECLAQNDCTTALAKLAQHEFDVLLFDLQLAECRVDGLDMIRQFLAADADLGVVALSALTSAAAAVDALQAGVRKVHMIDGRMFHSLLMEMFTDKGVGTEIVAASDC